MIPFISLGYVCSGASIALQQNKAKNVIKITMQSLRYGDFVEFVK